MKFRWCILFVIIVIVGIASQQQACLPNQEIVLRFTNNEVTSDEAQNAIAAVKNQLQTIGANNIHVQESQNGESLKITYYSDIDVANIKKLLSKEKDIKLGYTSYNQDEKQSKLPSKKKSKSYDIDVFEIKKHDPGFDLDGKYALESKLDKNRFLNTNAPISSKEESIGNNRIIEIASNFNKNIAIAINKTSHQIPDGRAGPTS